MKYPRPLSHLFYKMALTIPLFTPFSRNLLHSRFMSGFRLTTVVRIAECNKIRIYPDVGTFSYVRGHTAKTKYRKFETNIPRKGPNFHIHVSVSDLYIPAIGLPILLQENCGLILKYINRSQTHECAWEGEDKAK